MIRQLFIVCGGIITIIVFYGLYKTGTCENTILVQRCNTNQTKPDRIELKSPDNDILRRESIYLERYRRVLEVCKNIGHGVFDNSCVPSTSYSRHRAKIPAPHIESFIYDTVHKITWCPIYKAASTSWFDNFSALAGLNADERAKIKENWKKIIRTLWPPFSFYDGYKEFLGSQLSFFIVRHPFERLLSAYRDKLENKTASERDGTKFYYDKYGKDIVKQFRTNDSHAEGTEPTFNEFITYLTSIDLLTRADDHWRPFHASCTPCHLKYDVIAKFETLADDQNYIVTKANVNHIIKPSWKHLPRGASTTSTIRKYYSTINKSLLLKLYQQYKIDFDMFDYHIDDYMEIVS